MLVWLGMIYALEQSPERLNMLTTIKRVIGEIMKEKQIFSHILVPVDGSPPSRNAQELAVFVAKNFGSMVTALHVVAHEFMHPQLARFSPETPEYVTGGSPRTYQGEPWVRVDEPTVSRAVMEVTDFYRQAGEDALSDAVMVFKEEGISANQKLIEHADPAEAILREAEKENCDLIVMARSAELETSPHLGSVAGKVSVHAQVPVLLAAEGNRISKILVPVDGSKGSRDAAEYAGILADKTQAAMTLLYVQESGLFRLRPELTRKMGTDVLSSLAKGARVKADQRLESGDPAKVISQIAGGEGFDLVAMGVTGHGGIRRFMLGSVSNHVVHYSNHAVLLVK
jgi:nucleotide-binding universal stress UspA family protein